ncbi:fungal hydrophobin-domain-containing protein [Irpex lacteus]|nr:fungal hydrophobin-domain-containing protein [Irpex lacteus]
MFFNISFISFYVLFAFSALAVATPAPLEKRWGSPTTTDKPPPATTITVTAPGATGTAAAGNCNTGPIQCCQSTTTSNSDTGNILLDLLGIVVTGVDILLGIDCSPISVVGIGSGSACNASPVCCENNAVVSPTFFFT